MMNEEEIAALEKNKLPQQKANIRRLDFAKIIHEKSASRLFQNSLQKFMKNVHYMKQNVYYME
jgi:hypothetical protein